MVKSKHRRAAPKPRLDVWRTPSIPKRHPEDILHQTPQIATTSRHKCLSVSIHMLLALPPLLVPTAVRSHGHHMGFREADPHLALQVVGNSCLGNVL